MQQGAIDRLTPAAWVNMDLGGGEKKKRKFEETFLPDSQQLEEVCEARKLFFSLYFEWFLRGSNICPVPPFEFPEKKYPMIFWHRSFWGGGRDAFPRVDPREGNVVNSSESHLETFSSYDPELALFP